MSILPPKTLVRVQSHLRRPSGLTCGILPIISGSSQPSWPHLWTHETPKPVRRVLRQSAGGNPSPRGPLSGVLVPAFPLTFFAGAHLAPGKRGEGCRLLFGKATSLKELGAHIDIYLPSPLRICSVPHAKLLAFLISVLCSYGIFLMYVSLSLNLPF